MYSRSFWKKASTVECPQPNSGGNSASGGHVVFTGPDTVWGRCSFVAHSLWLGSSRYISKQRVEVEVVPLSRRTNESLRREFSPGEQSLFQVPLRPSAFFRSLHKNAFHIYHYIASSRARSLASLAQSRRCRRHVMRILHRLDDIGSAHENKPIESRIVAAESDSERFWSTRETRPAGYAFRGWAEHRIQSSPTADAKRHASKRAEMAQVSESARNGHAVDGTATAALFRIGERPSHEAVGTASRVSCIRCYSFRSTYCV